MPSRQELMFAGVLLVTAFLVGWVIGAIGWALFVAALIWKIIFTPSMVSSSMSFSTTWVGAIS